ncbi:MAG: glucosamine-6-phosphate deaminase [Chloroflexota bacterium]|nr:glucosamine-6-phosphate deaminase [Chloroflexota bacterium]
MRIITASSTWNLTVVPNAFAMGGLAADIVADTVRVKPNAVVSVPTGTTPLTLFEELAARSRRGEIDLSRIELFCLDDYVGVTADDPNSLTGWLKSAFIDRAGIDPDHVHSVPAAATDLASATLAYERDLAALGGLDLAIVGLGPNGHVAYNEPGSLADSRTRVVSLTAESRAQAAAYWRHSVPIPRSAVTIGVGTLLDAKQIVLVVTGESKAEMLRRTLEERTSADVPASWLRLAKNRLMVITDEAAASRLSGRRVSHS